MRYIIQFISDATEIELQKTKASINAILNEYKSSKVLARFYQDTWIDKTEHIIEVGYFDRHAIDEIIQLDQIKSVYQIIEENRFSLVEELIGCLSKATQDIEKFIIEFVIRNTDISSKEILDTWNVSDSKINEEHTDQSFILQIGGNYYRLLKKCYPP